MAIDIGVQRFGGLDLDAQGASGCFDPFAQRFGIRGGFAGRRHECRSGTHECVRHESVQGFAHAGRRPQ
jgi:hypothetical protein